MSKILKVLNLWIATVAMCSWFYTAQAAELSLSNSPLFLGSNIDPNVFFELDDSGSMDWETLTYDYNYYLTYWRDTTEGRVFSGVWENVTNETTTTTVGGGFGGGGFGGGFGGGGFGGGFGGFGGGFGGGGGGFGGGFGGGGFGGFGGFGGGGSTTTGGVRKEFLYMFAESDRLYTSGSVVTMTDHSQAIQRDWRARSVDFNLLYYNPDATYAPWSTALGNANFNSARSNPEPTSGGYGSTRNLDGLSFEVWVDDHGYVGSNRPNGPDDASDGPNQLVDLWDSHTKYTFSGGTLNWERYTVPNAAAMAALGVDCTLADAQDTVPYQACFGTTATSGSYTGTGINPWGRTVAQEQQNFANWYQYYRKRSYVAKGAVSRVIGSSNTFRYGMSLFNAGGSVFKEVPLTPRGTYPAHNKDLLETLYKHTWQSVGTPLRRGLETVGKYFDNTLSGKTDPIVSECQQNFSILLTDGFWNGGDPSVSDADGDSYYNTTADVAKYYYDKDLSPLSNDVPTSVIDPNNKQHMVSFTVAFGLRGNLVDTDGDGFPNPNLSENGNWGNVYSSNGFEQNAAKIDDLWHAAINSKGWYIAAQNPDDVVNALNDALSDITDRVGSSASVATNSGSLNAGSHLFQARFDSGGWSGQLLAFQINADATINPNPTWEASNVLDTQNYNTGRNIITYNPTTNKGVPFRFPSNFSSIGPNDIDIYQVGYLLQKAPSGSTGAQYQSYGEDYVNYLRGDRSNELVGAGFRMRNSALGDIVDSDPKFVGVPRFNYSDSLEAKAYSSYKSANATRSPMVYVGANDGMLHGFRESDGQELLAYVPSAVYETLPELGEVTYQHRFFVNEAPIVVDAYLPSKIDLGTGTAGAWQSILVGGLGSGGQSIYALNVSDPSSFSESNADDIVLWEFDDNDDADLGYTFGEIQVAKMANGRWAAVFSNGYNNTYRNVSDPSKPYDSVRSATGNAYLYIVDIETGALISKLSTEVGSPSTPNGLSTPSLIDVVGDDGIVDTIYAGDLLGNVWKFDVSDPLPSNWGSDYMSGGKPEPIFTTATGQPITSAIQVTRHPEGRAGVMLFFGTGKYLETGDNSIFSQPTQAFYGIWDKDLATLTPFTTSNLVQQYITDQFNLDFDTDGDSINDELNVARTTSDFEVDYEDPTTGWGWYIDLKPEKINGVANTNNFGEKQVSKSIVRDGRVIFTTVLPSSGACDFGGSSFIMELDFVNGGQLDFPAFDMNGDGDFDASDTLASGVQSDVGIVPTLNILTDTLNDRDIAIGSGSSGAIAVEQFNTDPASLGRQSWREIR